MTLISHLEHRDSLAVEASVVSTGEHVASNMVLCRANQFSMANGF